MKPRTQLNLAIACFMLAAIVYVASMVIVARHSGLLGLPRGYGGPAEMMGPEPSLLGAGRTAFSSDGERIYYRGVDASGRPLPFTDGPAWMVMHGGACIDCHGRDGRGGLAVIPGGGVSPDVRYSVLTGKEQPAPRGASEREHRPYTDETIKRAIVKGLDADGQELDRVMPRYQMSDQDLDDLIAHLKQLDELPVK